MAATPQRGEPVRDIRLIGGGDRLAYFEDAATGEDMLGLRFTSDEPPGLRSFLGLVGTLIRLDPETGEQIAERARCVEIRREGPLW